MAHKKDYEYPQCYNNRPARHRNVHPNERKNNDDRGSPSRHARTFGIAGPTEEEKQRGSDKIGACIYNPMHLLSALEIEAHQEICPDRFEFHDFLKAANRILKIEGDKH
ncbi:unnamed protein product [Auanema sp. JU1783]|nr:unnamed protein product [Auanema sp. JU1783]